MKALKFLILFTTIFSLVIVSSCKKDDDVDPNNNAPTCEAKTVEVPEAMANSSDPGVQQAVGYMEMVNGMGGYTGMMTPPSKSSAVTNFKDGGTEVYTWEINEGNTNCTFTLRVTETATMYSWEMIIDGTMEGMVFNNFTYIRAEEMKDGSSGEITIYDPETGNILITMSWYTSGGATHFTYEMPGYMLLTIVVNGNGSGYVEYSFWDNNQWALYFKAQWDASGHGHWWDYYSGTEGSW